MEKTNCEGLTWSEWYLAAFVPAYVPKKNLRLERKAWRMGEDPTAWRAAPPERWKKYAPKPPVYVSIWKPDGKEPNPKCGLSRDFLKKLDALSDSDLVEVREIDGQGHHAGWYRAWVYTAGKFHSDFNVQDCFHADAPMPADAIKDCAYLIRRRLRGFTNELQHLDTYRLMEFWLERRKTRARV